MPRRLLSLAALILLIAPIRPSAAQPNAAALCQGAIAQAEREANLPPRLLAAIGRVESGRRDPDTGATAPWPWTINAEGRGSFFPDRGAAIAAVRALQAQGVRSIDVGCMQINLRHHPGAFASLEEAFDPLANARYAARFLQELQTTRGDWLRSAAHYHSQTPEFAEAYRARVVAAWEAERGAPAPAGYAAALRAHGGFGPSGAGAAMLENSGTRGSAMLENSGTRGATPPPLPSAGAMLPPAGGGGAGRGLDAYRAQPISMIGRVTMPLATMPPPAPPPGAGLVDARRPAAPPVAVAGMPSLASPGLGLSAPPRALAPMPAGVAPPIGMPMAARATLPVLAPVPVSSIPAMPGPARPGAATILPYRPSDPLVALPARRS